MMNFRNKYLSGKENYNILDVGGTVVPTGIVPGIGGSYKPIFENILKYDVLDFKSDDPKCSIPDIIINSYDWPIEDESYDVVICGQVFEHDKFFWLTLNNVKRVTKRGGLICIIAPGAGPYHAHPVDCYRFYADCMKGFAEWMNVELLESSVDETSIPFKDVKGVFRRI